MASKTASAAVFKELGGVPVHYDRLPVAAYGSAGEPREWRCTEKLADTLSDCMEDLFKVWGQPLPDAILTAGVLGDGENAHGQGLAFDLDGFAYNSFRSDARTFTMAEYPKDRRFYVALWAHLFLFFPQVLGWHYPGHADHFHVDFNFGFRFRPESNAQTHFVQAALRHVFGQDIGKSGVEKDGVDGIYGPGTKTAVAKVLATLRLDGMGGLTKPDIWRGFLMETRELAFTP